MRLALTTLTVAAWAALALIVPLGGHVSGAVEQAWESLCGILTVAAVIKRA